MINQWLAENKGIFTIVSLVDNVNYLLAEDQLYDVYDNSITIDVAKDILSKGGSILIGSYLFISNITANVVRDYGELDQRIAIMKQRFGGGITSDIIDNDYYFMKTIGTTETLANDFNLYIDRLNHHLKPCFFRELMKNMVLLLNRMELNIEKIIRVLKFYDRKAGNPSIVSINHGPAMSLTNYLDQYNQLIIDKNYVAIPSFVFTGPNRNIPLLDNPSESFLALYDLADYLKIGIFILPERITRPRQLYNPRNKGFMDFRLLVVDQGDGTVYRKL